MPEGMRAAYDENSPVTGNFCVIVEDDPISNIVSKLCMESGYITNDKLKKDTDTQKAFDANATALMRDLSIVDSTGSVWYPLSMTIGNTVFYIAGTTSTWQWVISSMIELDSEDSEKYKIPGSDEHYKWHLDLENSQFFNSDSFPEAFESFHATLRIEYSKEIAAIQDSKENI